MPLPRARQKAELSYEDFRACGVQQIHRDIKALNILNKMPVDKEFVTEQEAPKFSQEIAKEMAELPPTQSPSG